MALDDVKKKMISRIASFVLIIATLCSPIVAFASITNSTNGVEIAEVKQKMIEAMDTETIKSFTYFEEVLGKDELLQVMNKYRAVSDTDDEAYEKLKVVLNQTLKEVEAYNFSEEQARALFLSAVDLETGNSVLSEMTYSDTIPSYAPSHEADKAMDSSFVDNTVMLNKVQQGIWFILLILLR